MCITALLKLNHTKSGSPIFTLLQTELQREREEERENSNGQYGELFGKEPAINKSMELKDLLVTELGSFPIIMMVLVESIIFFLCNAITYK